MIFLTVSANIHAWLNCLPIVTVALRWLEVVFRGGCLLLVELNIDSVEPYSAEGVPEPFVRKRTLRSGRDVITGDVIEIHM
jgi:hypothetical protein